jgi:hypothetical protein
VWSWGSSRNRARTAHGRIGPRLLYFDDDTTSLEASISDEHEHLYKLMDANKMKPCHLTVNLREYKGQRFIDVTGYAPTGAVSLPPAGK